MDQTRLRDVHLLLHCLLTTVSLNQLWQFLLTSVLAQRRGAVPIDIHQDFRTVVVVALGQAGLEVAAEVVTIRDFDGLKEFVFFVHDRFIGGFVEFFAREQVEPLAD